MSRKPKPPAIVEDEFPPLPPEEEAARVARLQAEHLAQLEFQLQAAEMWRAAEQKVSNFVLQGGDDSNLSAEVSESRVFQDLRAVYTEVYSGFGERQRKAERTAGVRAAGAVSAAAKKAEKAAREARWRERAAVIIKARPGIGKNDLVTAIAHSDLDVASGDVGPNAISRAVSISDIKARKKSR